MSKLKNVFKKYKSNKLIKDYLWVFFGQNLGSIFAMLSIIVTLKIISTEEYGSLTVVQTYCLLISNLFSLRTFNGIIKYTTEAENNKNTREINKYISSAVLLDVLAGIVALTASILLIKPVTAFMGWSLSTIKYVSFYIPVIFFYPILNGAPTGILRKTGNFKKVNIIHALVYGFQLISLLIIFLIGIREFRIVLLDYAITEIAETVIITILAFSVIQRNEKYKSFWKCGLTRNIEFYKYNFYYGLMLSFDQILSNVSTLLINKYVGNLVTAYLKIITKICSMITKLTNPISQVFYPKLCEWIAKGNYKKSLAVCRKYFIVVLGTGTVLGLALFTTYNIWIPLFDSEMSAAKLQSILYFSFSLMSVSIICYHQLSLTLDMMKHNLIIVAVFDLAYLALLIPCIINFGVYGYLALQIGQLICVFISKILVMKYKIHKLDLARSRDA